MYLFTFPYQTSHDTPCQANSESCVLSSGTQVLLNGSEHQSGPHLNLSGSEWLIKVKIGLVELREKSVT